MTGRDARLRQYRATAARALEKHQGTVFRYEGVWEFRQAGQVFDYPCCFQLKDPRKGGARQQADALATAQRLGVAFEDLRLLKAQPDQERPPEGSVLQSYRFLNQEHTTYDGADLTGGGLVLREWSAPSDFTDIAVGHCVIRR